MLDRDGPGEEGKKGEEGGAVSLQGDQVVLDLSEVIDQVKQRLVARGLTIVEKVPIPDKDRQIVLLEAPQLKQARTIYAFANPVALRPELLGQLAGALACPTQRGFWVPSLRGFDQ